MLGVGMVYELKGGRFLRKVQWDQMWHLLEKRPQENLFAVGWKRVTSRAAGGYLRHRVR